MKRKKSKRGRPRIPSPLRELAGVKERDTRKKNEKIPQRLYFPPKKKGMSEGEYKYFKFEYLCETYLRHPSGPWACKPFILELWQKKIAKAIFCTLKKKGTRQYRKLLIHVARRNGKSTLAAAFILYWVCEESFDDPAAEIYGASGDEKQAALIFKICQGMIRQSDELAQLLIVKPFYHRIVNPLTHAVYEVLSSKIPTKPGRNSSLVIIDETWGLPSGELWQVMETSLGSRAEPLMISLSTAGESTGSFYYELYDYAKKVKADPSIDPAFYSAIFEVEPDADPFDERNWYKANPGLNKYRSLEEMRELCNRAKQFPTSEGEFRRHYLNQWVSMGVESWIPSLIWDQCSEMIDYGSLHKRRCFIGIDLSSTIDVAAVVLFFEPAEGETVWDVSPSFWVPGADLVSKARADHLAYDSWAAQGLIIFEGKEAIDFHSIEQMIIEMDSKYNIVAIGFDPWRAKDLIDNLQNNGFQERLVPIPQQFSFMSDATGEIQRKAHMKELRHGGHPVLRAMSENTKLVIDSKGNRMIDKKKSRTRVDGISALCIAQAVATKFKNIDKRSVYEDRGILVIKSDTDDLVKDVETNEKGGGYCKRCRKPLEPGMEFCPNCGLIPQTKIDRR
jgi:phage terminase large subunit-like protein